MKNTWLHFIGKSYYSISKFVKEAEQIGVSRAISFNIFKKMNIGDTIILAQWNGKYSLIFGYFNVEIITGIKPEKLKEMEDQGFISKASGLPSAIQRGCGSYIITGSYGINDKEKTAQYIKSLEKEDFDRLMIGGQYYNISELINIVQPDLIINFNRTNIKSNIPFQQGFRLFDLKSFRKQLLKQKGKIKGMFYFDQYYDNNHFIEDTKLLQIDNYKLN